MSSGQYTGRECDPWWEESKESKDEKLEVERDEEGEDRVEEAEFPFREDERGGELEWSLQELQKQQEEICEHLSGTANL